MPVDNQSSHVVELADCSFAWKSSDKIVPSVKTDKKIEMTDTNKNKWQINGVNLVVGKGELVLIVGKVGSGKSSILYSLFNETDRVGSSNSSMRLCDDCTYLG